MNKKILEIKNLKKIFQYNNEKIEILKNLNLTLKKGELIALTGPSGSGKSTLLHMIALLEKPTSGKIFFLNKNTSKLSESEIDDLRKKKLSLIFQNHNLISDLSVTENVMLPLLIRDYDPTLSLKKTYEILKKVNLINRCNFYPNDLSGGEQQRVAIARTLISETELILADEPTGNLDYVTSKDIFNYFIKLKKMNKTILFATHNRELANRADYRLSISNGIIKRLNG